MTCKTLARFWAKVDRRGPDDCWEWLGATVSKGYGVISINNRHVYTHRLAWELKHGPIPPGLEACHHCDNPACCNEGHIFIGTQKDNTEDMMRKGRGMTGRTWVKRYCRLGKTWRKRVFGPHRVAKEPEPELTSDELRARADQRKCCKLSCAQVEEIRRSYRGRRGEQSRLAAQYQVTRQSISYILQGKYWAWLDATSDCGEG